MNCNYCGQTIKQKGTRSIKSNRLYWARLRVLADVTGDLPEDLHVFIMHRCGFTKDVSLGGVTVTTRESSAQLDQKHFSELLKKTEQIAIWLTSETGQAISLPE